MCTWQQYMANELFYQWPICYNYGTEYSSEAYDTYPESDELFPLGKQVTFDAIVRTLESDGSDQKSKYENVRQCRSHVDDLQTLVVAQCDDVVVFQAEDGIRDAQESRGLGDVYKRQSSASCLMICNAYCIAR